MARKLHTGTSVGAPAEVAVGGSRNALTGRRGALDPGSRSNDVGLTDLPWLLNLEAAVQLGIASVRFAAMRCRCSRVAALAVTGTQVRRKYHESC